MFLLFTKRRNCRIFLAQTVQEKSTSLKIICGYLCPDKGRVTINDIDVMTHRIEAQKQLGYLPESNPLYPELRVEDFLIYCAKIRDLVVHKEARP